MTSSMSSELLERKIGLINKIIELKCDEMPWSEISAELLSLGYMKNEFAVYGLFVELNKFVDERKLYMDEKLEKLRERNKSSVGTIRMT